MGLLRRKAAVPRSEGERTVFFASDLSALVTGQWLRVNGGAI